MYRPVLVTPPVIAPVSLSEVKAHCRAADFTDDDGLLGGLISAATSFLDGWTGVLGRALCEQTWRQDFNDFRSCLRLPLFPVISVSSVKYTDVDGADQTVSPAEYTLRNDDLGAFVEFSCQYSFPALNAEAAAVRVEYVAGYADTPAADAVEADPEADPPVSANAAVPRSSNVPAAIKQAMLLMVSNWYQNRDAVVIGQQPTEVPMAVAALIAPYRRLKF